MPRIFPSLLLLILGVANAQDHICYHVQCHLDSSGTIWCDNQEFECTEMSGQSCDPIEVCDVNAPEGCMCACSSCSGTSGLVVERPRPPKVRKPFVWTGGLGGYGADGGAFERQAAYRVETNWDIFDHQYDD